MQSTHKHQACKIHREKKKSGRHKHEVMKKNEARYRVSFLNHITMKISRRNIKRKRFLKVLLALKDNEKRSGRRPPVASINLEMQRSHSVSNWNGGERKVR